MPRKYICPACLLYHNIPYPYMYSYIRCRHRVSLSELRARVWRVPAFQFCSVHIQFCVSAISTSSTTSQDCRSADQAPFLPLEPRPLRTFCDCLAQVVCQEFPSAVVVVAGADFSGRCGTIVNLGCLCCSHLFVLLGFVGFCWGLWCNFVDFI